MRLVGDHVVFEVELGAPIKKPTEIRLSDATILQLDNNIYAQNVDIYIDRDSAEGVVESIPGRRVRFYDDDAWDTAIVLTPQPYVVRSGLEDWAPGRNRVLVPTDVRSENRTVRAVVSVGDLGGVPDASWGFQVLVTGASWQSSFDAFQRVMGAHVPNALTMKVTTISEPGAFGGGELHDVHPYVIDLLAPRGREQGPILRSFDVDAERYAVVPLVYVDPAAHARAVAQAGPRRGTPVGALPARPTLPGSVLSQGLIPSGPAPRDPDVVATYPPGGAGPWARTSTAPPKPGPRPVARGQPPAGQIVLTVQSVDGNIVVLEKPTRRVKRFQFGVVFDPGGDAVGRVVLDQEYPAFLLATIVEGVGSIRAGATVRFDPPKE